MTTLHTVANNDSWLQFTLDESRNWDVTSVTAHAGTNPITLQLLNADGSVKTEVVIPAGTETTRNLNPSQRVQGVLDSGVNAAGETKLRLLIPHRILW